MAEAQKEVLASEKKLKAVKTKKTADGRGVGSKILSFLQELGKALQIPVAVLPFAAILTRFGALGIQYTDEGSVGYWISFIINKPGQLVMDNLALMFAIGTAFGLAKDKRGEAALSGVVVFLILNAFTAEHGLPEMIYKNVLTFDFKTTEAVWNGTSYDTVEVTGTLSQLFYVPNGVEGSYTGGTYVLGIGVLGGIVSGITAAVVYEKFKDIKLPTALAFFGGRRFVPMVCMVLTIPIGLLFAIIWPWIQFGLIKMGQTVADPNNPAVAVPGTMLYAALNRLLLPFGLHQILNTLFWFQLPVYGDLVEPLTGNIINDANGWVNGTDFVGGDINAFTKGVSSSGLFQSGFFPVMMGGIPAIALAMIFTANKDRRKEVAGFLGGVAAVSFISGITEPIEFSFVFVAPILLILHVVLSSIFVGITTGMHIQVGFGFSAGLIDYAASFAQSWGLAKYAGEHLGGAYSVIANPLWILALVAAAGAVYFFAFTFVIKKMNLPTPGRETDVETGGSSVQSESAKEVAKKASKAGKAGKEELIAQTVADVLGDNLLVVDNCITRLRLTVKDNSNIDDAAIKASGAFGVKRLGKESYQVVIGPGVEKVADILKKLTSK